MRVEMTDYTSSFRANNAKYFREIRGHLSDNSTALVKFTMNQNKDINALEGYVLDKGIVREAKGMRNSGGLGENDIFPLLENLQLRAKAGVDFFKEFTRALISK